MGQVEDVVLQGEVCSYLFHLKIISVGEEDVTGLGSPPHPRRTMKPVYTVNTRPAGGRVAGCQPPAAVSVYTAVPGSRPRETGTQTISVDVPQPFSKGRRVEGLDSHLPAPCEDEPSPKVPPAPFI